MRSTEAGISRLGCGWRVADTTTASCCAATHPGAAAASSAARILVAPLMSDRLHAMARFFLALALFLAGAAAAQPNAALVDQLRAGGYVLYMRHTSTDFSQNDSRMQSYADCANQRNLTDKGRDEARLVGQQVKRLNIPIGEVLASPYCRTMETARLAVGKATAMPEERGGPAPPDHGSRYGGLKKLLSSEVAKGTNRVSSSHGNSLYALAGPPPL